MSDPPLVANPSSPPLENSAAVSPLPSLGQRTTRGFAWLLGQTIGTKVVGLLGQWALAQLLAAEDFGLIGLTYVVAGFASLVQQTGLREILVARQRQFEHWSNPGFWMSLSAGLLAACLMIIASPIAALIYREDRLIWLILIAALGAPVDSLTTVPMAKLQVQMRFGLIATVQLLNNVGVMGLTVLLAALHFGVYSFVIPKPLMAVLCCLIYWVAARPTVRRTPEVRQWRGLLSDSGALMTTAFFTMLISQGDYLTLGYFHDVGIVGIYYFAFNLSLQTVQLITGNVTFVLMPSLSSLSHDRDRQIASFLKACQLLMAVAVPLCVLQAAVGPYALDLLYGSKWSAAIPVFQVLSLGMSFAVAVGPVTGLLQAQGRFRTALQLTMLSAVVFLLLVLKGALSGEALSVACYVCGFLIFQGIFGFYIAIRRYRRTLKPILQIFFVPLGTSLVVAAPFMLATRLLPPGKLFDFAACVLITIGGGVFYLGLLQWLQPEVVADARHRLHSLLAKDRIAAAEA